jgi:hypothetical protein
MKTKTLFLFFLGFSSLSFAQNGANFNGATSTVFVGMGRRFSLGLKVGFK